jgi:uncharacterized membrane protein YfcA
MDPTFLGVDGWTFAALAVAPMLTNFLGVTLGAAGGLLLLAVMALVFPPAVLIPVHTVVQLGSVTTRTMMMWRWIMRGTLLPFLAGAVLGAAAGAQIFVALPTAALQGILGAFILVVAWLPRLARAGGQRRRFALMGFGATFLGVFVSATGTLLTPFVAAASPSRHNYAATFSALMFILHLSKLAAFGALGIAIGAYLPLMAAMIAFAAAGNWLGRHALDRMPERLFRIVLKTVLSVLALRLLWVAARNAGWI